MKIAQYVVDWKEDFCLKHINKLAKLVGGKKCLREYSQDVVDCKVMFISSEQLDYDQLDLLWDKAEFWNVDVAEGKGVKEIAEKMLAENMRRELVDKFDNFRIVHDKNYVKEDLDKYTDKLSKMSDRRIRNLFKKTFPNGI